MKKNGVFSLLLTFLLGLSGCGPVDPAIILSPIAELGIMWVNGEAIKYYEYDSVVVYRATKRSLRELGFPNITDKAEVDGYSIVDARFIIHVSAVRPGVTKLSIRVNIMGDKPFAELIYRNVDNHVGIIEFNQGQPVQKGRVTGRPIIRRVPKFPIPFPN